VTTKQRVATPLPGYLYPMRRGSYVGPEQPVALKVACPCGRWHNHGAGTVQTPHDHRPGQVVHRASHCPRFDYRSIVIQPETFSPSWATATGRQSAAYLRTLAA
jgi:hypothetical protein